MYVLGVILQVLHVRSAGGGREEEEGEERERRREEGERLC